MSAAIAIHSDAIPNRVRPMKASFSPKAKVIFCLIVAKVRRECCISQGSLERSSDMSAMSAVSIAASVPIAPMAIPKVATAIAGASLTPSPTISHGADVNARVALLDTTPLHAGCEVSRSEVVELLLAAGARVDARKGLSGQTPLHVLCWPNPLTEDGGSAATLAALLTSA